MGQCVYQKPKKVHISNGMKWNLTSSRQWWKQLEAWNPISFYPSFPRSDIPPNCHSVFLTFRSSSNLCHCPTNPMQPNSLTHPWRPLITAAFITRRSQTVRSSVRSWCPQEKGSPMYDDNKILNFSSSNPLFHFTSLQAWLFTVTPVRVTGFLQGQFW